MTLSVSKDVRKVLDTYPESAKAKLLQIRELILSCAAEDSAIGVITETLKWGEPAYLTEQSKSGSTIRLGYKDSAPDSVAIYFNCNTTIVKDIQRLYTDQFQCEGNRQLSILIDQPLPEQALSECLTLALKYHVNKKVRAAGLL